MNEDSIEKTKKTYETDVSSIEEPMARLCEIFKSSFEAGNYGLILGDDTSGRLPTLVMKGVADSISDKVEKPRPATVFVQAGRYATDKQVEEQFNKRVRGIQDKIPHGKRIMLVTDHVETAGTLLRLVNHLKDINVPFDIAIMHEYTNLGIEKVKEALPSDSFMVSGDRTTVDLQNPRKPAPQIWGRDELTGIKKPLPQEPLGTVPKTYNRVSSQVQPYINRARSDIKLASERIIARLYPSKAT